jgi:amidase
VTPAQWLDATGEAALVHAGEASPLELVEAGIERLQRVNPALNAVVHERFEKARREAAAFGDGAGAAPFAGVPILLKDLGARSAGDPYHAGARFLAEAGFVSDHDSALVTKLRRAGFVVLGRTNVPELGTTITTEPVLYGPTRNPWSPDRSPGGSSGGSAAAVAAGAVAVAHAEDGGGSIRIPASACGLVGLKPTRGRVSLAPDAGDEWGGAVCAGCVTRSVRDTAAVLDCIAGYVAGDPNTAPAPRRPFAGEVGADPGRLRVGLLDHSPLLPGERDEDCAAAVHEAGRLLERLGHAVEESHPPALDEHESARHSLRVVAASVAADLDRWSATLGRDIEDGELEAGNVIFREIGRSVSAMGYVESIGFLQGFSRRMAVWWRDGAAGADSAAGDAGFDLLVTPVLAAPPPELGWLSDPLLGPKRVPELLQFTGQFNVSGQPAISLPLHWTSSGVPVGVQLVAAFGREDLLLRVASQLEEEACWGRRHPPLNAFTE